MIFNKHSNLEGQHAFLGASTYHWLNYSEEKLIDRFRTQQAAQKGTELHELAARCIKLGVKLPRTRKTLDNYVNDAIGFKMSPEVVLFYSEFCFGTADAISFRNNFLRIHDLKTGTSPVSMLQLQIYAALFCLEYKIKPSDIEVELRIYQNDDIEICNPTAEDIVPIMDKIVTNTKILREEMMRQ